MDNVSLQQIFNRIPLLKYWYRGSFPSDYVPTLDNDNFAIINTQPSNMQRSFPSGLPKRVYPVSLRMHKKSAQRKPAKHKKTSRGKISKRGSTIVSKRTT